MLNQLDHPGAPLYLFIRDRRRERETERETEAETQEEGEAGSMPGA